MKRAGDLDIEIPSKKPRSAPPDYFHDSPKRKVQELIKLGGNDDDGYIEGKVFMIWPPRNRSHRINLEVAEDANIYRFEVEVPHRDRIRFRPHDHIYLALKGMQAEQRKDSSAPHCFPIVLRYSDGVVLKYLSGVNAGEVVDTWAGDTDEWYEPGKVHTVSDPVVHSASESRNSSIPEVPLPAPPTRQTTDATGSRGEIVNADRASVHHGTSRIHHAGQQPNNNEKSGHLSRAQAKRRKRLRKERKLVLSNQVAQDERPAEVPAPRHDQPFLSAEDLHHFPTTPNSTSHQIEGDSRGQASISTINVNSPPRENNPSDPLVANEESRLPLPRIQAGIRTQRGDVFSPLDTIHKNSALINVIGVVVSVSSEKKTNKNDWSRSFAIVDSSLADPEGNGFRVNCFQKKYVEWLPQVKKDDVVILRRLRATEFNGAVSATGYHDKLRWAIYDPSNHAIRPPIKGGAPEKEAIDHGLGYEFSPYWEPFDGVELDYCRRVAEWWKALQGLKPQDMVAVKCNAPVTKQHLLISEASPDLEPRGFFNCTVEILQKFDNPAGATSVYVTDYTSNPLVHPIQSTWCPPELSEYVLQCDMWDKAKDLARLMEPGEYWYFYNVRARWSASHYMEATMQLTEKVTHLDEANLEQPHLAALVARKKEFGKDPSASPIASGSSRIFPDMLIQDADEGTNFISCTVELLHVDVNSRDGHFIHVTDYTYNPNLPGCIPTADWAQGLAHRIVKIKLDDAQTKKSVDDLMIGSTYTIYNLRLRHTTTSGGLQGRLGGEDRLITPLDDLSSQRAEMLLRNKENWQREVMLDHSTTLPNAPPDESHPSNNHNAAEETSSELPKGQFRILARAVDFFPDSLDDACSLRCTKCDSSPPPSFKQCPRCDDMMESNCKWVYQFYVCLQDEVGTEFKVSLSGKECTLLQDVEPADFRSDQAAFRKFLQKVEPILGNVRQVSSGEEDQAIDSPQMRFTLDSWMIGDQRLYGLIDCVPA